MEFQKKPCTFNAEGGLILERRFCEQRFSHCKKSEIDSTEKKPF